MINFIKEFLFKDIEIQKKIWPNHGGVEDLACSVFYNTKIDVLIR